MLYNKILKLAVLPLAMFASSANASTLDGATTSAGTFALGDIDNTSYDGAGYNIFNSFSTFTTPDLYKVNSFTGQSLGSELQVTLLSENACFDGMMLPFANKFGVLDDKGDFHTIIDSATASAGSSGSINQGSSEGFTFALMSPEGTFSSIDSQNSDNSTHIIAKVVTDPGKFSIDPTSVHGSLPLDFEFQVGDIILFIEDMRLSGNSNFLVPSLWDADYNDFVVVVRQVQLPEPATLALMGLGSLVALRRKKRTA
ncbi:MAG: PEP-CTERM sorting domain-containing protein [Proteobacteria bacterium]|nr:PEP-CTERM sorting domain-containing protein [Pseudomonadota bacterium]